MFIEISARELRFKNKFNGGVIFQFLMLIYLSIVQIWNASNHRMVGSLPTVLDVRSMAISSELIYLGCKGGIVEIWGREKNNRVETLQSSKNGKVNCMTLDGNEEFLVIGTADGQIQVNNLFPSVSKLRNKFSFTTGLQTKCSFKK